MRLVFIVVPLYLLCCFCTLFALLSFKLTPAGVDSHLSEYILIDLVINSLKIVKEKDEVQCGCAKKPCWKMVHSCLMH